MNEKELKEVEGRVLPMLSSVEGVTKILGVGSYYIPRNKPPSDLDYLLVLDFSLTDIDKTRSLGEFLEGVKEEYSGDKYGKKVRSIVSIFLKDVDGYYLNGEELAHWYNEEFGFTLEDLQKETDKTTRYRTGWGEASSLWSQNE